ncbi:MAG: ZIP family metal transporter [Lachnospiraceae bacterium]|nr:ZIP family metal transporter [Lachnospiraceae bacterium]
MEVVRVLGLPFLGTGLGAAMVFFLRGKITPWIEKILLGFAAGVMIAASVWSLLIPAIEMAEEQQQISWLPALVGFLSGIVFLLLMDVLVPHLHLDSQKPEGCRVGFSKTAMLLFAVTLHNIPEGMAVGVALAGALVKNSHMHLSGVYALAMGIAIQNFPEGAVISMPLRSQGLSRCRAFIYGVLSGVVEPIGGYLTLMLASKVALILPYFLSFAAGAMLYVVIEELIPESQQGEHSNIGTIGAALGFSIMMVLDVALG